jgi:hypothetical protein
MLSSLFLAMFLEIGVLINFFASISNVLIKIAYFMGKNF